MKSVKNASEVRNQGMIHGSDQLSLHVKPGLRRLGWLGALSVLTLLSLTSCDRPEKPSTPAKADSASSSVALLLDKLEESDINRLVFLNDVHLEKTQSGSALYAIGKNGNRILLVNVPKKMMEISEDSLYDVFGSIQKAPSVQSAKRLLKLNKIEATNLSKDQFYIDASSVAKEEDR